MAFAPLARECRGKTLDLTHFGYLVIVDENSKVLYSVGDPDDIVFYRSASKPVQALPVIARGLDRKFGLTEEETTIFAGSHAGEEFHIAALESILNKTGLREDMLVMKPAVPSYTPANEARIRKGLAPRKLYHNCAGKHEALMLLQRELGGEVRDYWKEDSPAQREIKRVVAGMSEFPEERVGVGLDGCGVPVFAVGMKNIAIAFKNLACPDKIADPELAAAAARYAPRIHRYPNMMRGINMLCSDINFDGAIVAKGGANGVYGIGLKDRRMGISIKLLDGCDGMWPVIIHDVLKFLGHDNEDTYAMLEKKCPHVMINDNGTPCGRRECVFKLEKC